MEHSKESGRAPRGSASPGKPRTGRIRVRARSAEYRAVARAQSARVRKEIASAVKEGERLRASIESRIDAAMAPGGGGRSRGF